MITYKHIDNNKLKSTPTTSLVSILRFNDGRTLEYGYDAEERITSVVDKFVLNGKTYTYGDSKWKDLLTEYDGQTITYDAGGNPINYLGHTLTWEKGRQLKSFDDITYTYNANGIRTSKTVNGVKHEYTLDGTNIVKETWDGNTLIPLYDNTESVCGIIYNGISYYFLKNLQGDVISITDATGSVVAKYSYDAWGVCTIEGDATVCKIADINPYRYRSYYFDRETGYYYLQSRYYNPENCRFINADDSKYIGATGTQLSVNAFAYCENNVVNYLDNYGSIRKQIKAFTFTYNRDKAVNYAKKWYNARNKNYYSYGSDCANFVSQCLYAGGMTSMTLGNDGWHCFKTKKKWYDISNIFGLFRYKYYYNWDVGSAWRLANEQYKYFKESVYKNECFMLKKKTNIGNAIKKHHIQKGDLMYFDFEGDSHIEHATMISKVGKGRIYYTAHTDSKWNEDINTFFKKHKDGIIYVITIKDNIK